MHHSLARIAASHFLSHKKLIAFASTDEARKKYRIDRDTEPTVSTWHVDSMVNDFQKTQTDEELCNDRNAEIKRQQNTSVSNEQQLGDGK